MSASPTVTTRGLAAIAGEVINTLRQQRLLYRQLLRLSQEERAAVAAPAGLVSTGALPLDEIVVSKEQIVARLGDLEQTRVRLCGALAAAHGLPREARLADVLPRLAPPLARLLRAERLALLSDVQALGQANVANVALLESALQTTRSTIGYLRALQGCLYDADGRATDPVRSARRLDRQA